MDAVTDLGRDFGSKLALTLALVAALALLRWGIGAVAERALRGRPEARLRFWTWQLLSLAFAAALIAIGVRVWFPDVRRLGVFLGLLSAGLAFALQKVITSFAAYCIILRSRTFRVGDRVFFGGVRGEVIALGFMQTTIMEMGQTPGEQGDAPSIWVNSRQFTGRIVTVTNDRIFEQAVYNYTRDFRYIWDEIRLPVAYRDDRGRAEAILRDVGDRLTRDIAARAHADLQRLRDRYATLEADTGAQTYWRLTDNWLEITLRYLAPVEQSRALKDHMSREILTALDEARIGIASATFEIVGLPKIDTHVEVDGHATP
jgi:small-conductance mechanosensitive channel